MGNSPNEQQPHWPWWKATWDWLLILFSSSVMTYTVVAAMPPKFYQALFPGMGQFDTFLGAYTFMLFVWPGLQALIVFKWMNWRGVQHAILPLWPLTSSFRKAATLISIFTAVFLSIYLVMNHFGLFPPDPDAELFGDGKFLVFAWLFIFSGVVVAPIAEEAVFRGFLQSAFQASRLGFWGASLVVSILWSLIHRYEWQPSLMLVAAGICLTYLRRETGSLLPGMIAHGAVNLALFMIYLNAKL